MAMLEILTVPRRHLNYLAQLKRNYLVYMIFICKDSFSKINNFIGSLEQLPAKSPPKTLKIRTFSIEEQEEQEAASGTHDKRVRRNAFLYSFTVINECIHYSISGYST